MLEWLEVWLDVGGNKRLVYEYCIELLNSDRDALKQECFVMCNAGSGILLPTRLIFFQLFAGCPPKNGTIFCTP